jgi:hypothetical protein
VKRITMASKKSSRRNDSSTPMIALRRRNSLESLGRYSEHSLHSNYVGRYGGGKCIRNKL